MDEPILQIRMLGSFSMTISGKPVAFKNNRDSKTNYLLQYLLQNSGRSFPKEKLIDVVYGEDEIENPVKALQVLMTRLRKALLDAGLPKQEYIYYSGGMYGWSVNIPCEIDTRMFEDAIRKSRSPEQTDERRIELYTQAIELYNGDFLPSLTGNDWAMVVSANYSNLYLQCFEQIWELLREKGDYQTMLKLCAKGLDVAPSEEKLHMIYITCLIEEHRLKEALAAYHAATDMLLSKWCTTPSEELQCLYKQISGKLKDDRHPIGEIRDELKEKTKQRGAYYCTLMSFVDSYRLVSRIAERSGQSLYLMLCNLTDLKGEKPEPGERLTHAAKCLSEAVKSSLRTGDLYTRYSTTQFLVLLVGTSLENCAPISERIAASYRKLYQRRGIRLQYSILPASEFDMDGDSISFANSKSTWKSDETG